MAVCVCVPTVAGPTPEMVVLPALTEPTTQLNSCPVAVGPFMKNAVTERERADPRAAAAAKSLVGGAEAPPTYSRLSYFLISSTSARLPLVLKWCSSRTPFDPLAVKTASL